MLAIEPATPALTLAEDVDTEEEARQIADAGHAADGFVKEALVDLAIPRRWSPLTRRGGSLAQTIGEVRGICRRSPASAIRFLHDRASLRRLIGDLGAHGRGGVRLAAARPLLR